MSFDSVFKGLWEKGKKIDPLTTRALEAIVKQDSKGVREVARAIGFTGLQREADKNVNDPARGIGRAAATVGALYGGAAALGAGGGGAATGAAATEGGAAAGGGAAFNAAADSQLANAGGSAVWGSAGNGMAGETVATNAPSSVNLSNAKGGFSPQFQKLMSMRSQPQQPQMQPLRDVETEDNPYIAQLSLSSKKAKKPAKGVAQAIERGAKRENPIDTNGVQMAAIKALHERFARIAKHMGA